MGPDQICLDMALFILNAHPNITLDPYTFGYSIQEHIDKEYDQFIAGEFSCNDFACALKLKHPLNIIDDEALLAATIQDFTDKVKTGDDESE